MSWLKISFAVKKTELDHVSETLEQAGAQAVTIEDAGDHPVFDLLDGELPVWDSNLLTGLFNAELGVDAVLSQLANAFAPDVLPSFVSPTS